MVPLLVLVGLLLIIFGALVLVVFPNRPGGEIGWHGLKVSSPGAGLPILALGVVLILSAGPGMVLPSWFPFGSTAPSGQGNGYTGCLGDYLTSIPGNRITRLESGAQAVVIIGIDQPKGEPFAVVFTENNQALGALKASYFPDNELFKVQTLVDARCQNSTDYENATRGGDKQVLVNWDSLQMRFGGQTYQMRLGFGGADISASFDRVVL